MALRNRILNAVGRRMTIRGCALPLGIGAVLQANSHSFAALATGRVMCGIGVGLTSVVTPMSGAY